MESQVVATNRKARHEYNIFETFEAGLELLGTEVKSCRAGRVNLKESYVTVRNSQVFLIGSHISQYSHEGYVSHEPVRDRRLLLHGKEIGRIRKQLDIKGLTAVPLKMYFNDRGWAKLEIGIAKGKKHYDKKAAKKEKDILRDTERELKGRR